MTARMLGSLFVLMGATAVGLFTGCGGLGGVPLRAAGSACGYDSQCSSQSCSAPADGGCGVCVDVRGLGQACGGPLERCSGSASCAGGVCKSSKKTLGEACTIGAKGESFECDDELHCAPDSLITSQGTCVARGVLGGACDGLVNCALGAQCSGGECVVASLGAEGDSCDGRQCVAGLFCGEGICRRATLPIGADCGGPDRGLNRCAPGGSCELTGGPIPPGGYYYPVACFPVPQEGEPCPSGQCGEGLFCPGQFGSNVPVCGRLRTRVAGQDCGFRDVCNAGLECRSGVCVEPC